MSGTSEPDKLVQTMMRFLELDTEWRAEFDPDDTEGITEARSAGRKAGRALGVKVRTYQAEIAHGRKVLVMVSLNQRLSDEDHKRVRDRWAFLVNEVPYDETQEDD